MDGIRIRLLANRPRLATMKPLLNGRGLLAAVAFLAYDPYRLTWQLGVATWHTWGRQRFNTLMFEAHKVADSRRRCSYR